MTFTFKPDLAILKTNPHTKKYYNPAFSGGKNKANTIIHKGGATLVYHKFPPSVRHSRAVTLPQ